MKLTTECGYQWRWANMYFWKGFYRPRPLIENGERVGVVFGPVMFFWKWNWD